MAKRNEPDFNSLNQEDQKELDFLIKMNLLTDAFEAQIAEDEAGDEDEDE